MDRWSTVIRLTPAILIITGCASVGPRIPDDCRSDLARAAESIEEVLDSAGTQLALEELWSPSTGMVLATLRYDSLGTPDTVFVYSESVSEDSRIRLIGSLMSIAKEAGAPGLSVDLFLGDALGPNLRRVDRFVGCRPRILNGEWLSKGVGQIGKNLGLSERRSVVLWAFVEEDGRVGRVRIQESSGHLGFDQEVARLFRGAEFQPAMLEGLAIPVWAAFPVTARSGGRGDGRPDEGSWR